jgi:AraC-like DNA-binding protein
MITNAAQFEDEKTWFRYMPPNPEAELWGAYVNNVGFQVIPPNTVYTPYNEVHPPDYRDPWEPGRIFHSYAFVYITRGAGEFDSKPSGRRPLRAGDLFVIFPDVWNRYRPFLETGWDEYWLQFDGDYIRRLMAREEFSPEDPVHHIGARDDILDLILKAIELSREEPPRYHLLLGTLATQAIARLLSALKHQRQEGRPVPEIIREAKRWLVSEPAQENLDRLASRLNMSYTSFRRLFKAETGFSPRQFALEARLRKAADLLDRTDTPVHQIAEQCGMESVYYFSRLFKKRTGLAPTAFRRLHGKAVLR